jgi:hypothetical protein
LEALTSWSMTSDFFREIKKARGISDKKEELKKIDQENVKKHEKTFHLGSKFTIFYADEDVLTGKQVWDFNDFRWDEENPKID